MDGRYDHFESEREAYLWLREDEYDELESLQEDGEVEVDLIPPTAPSDDELLPLMLVYRDGH